MRVLIAASEVAPLAKTGGLADVIGSLPRYLKEAGVDVSVIMPKYRWIHQESLGQGEFLIPIGKKNIWGKIERSWLPDSDIPLFFVVQNHYFGRNGLYGENGQDYPDNLERFTFFCRAILEIIKRGLESPQIIHANDWQTGLLPTYIKTIFADHPELGHLKSLYTVHNLAYQGTFPSDSLFVTGIGEEHFHMGGLEFYGQLCLMKAGIEYADFINTVSRKYADEIETEEFGCGLEGVLQRRSGQLTGILNGVDYSRWSPENDQFITKTYNIDSFETGKRANKKALLERFGLPVHNDRVPLYGVISRLASQKGLDLFAEVIPSLIDAGSQIVVLGTGESKLEETYRKLMQHYPQSCGVEIKYDNELAHLIEAGADMFVMPSRYEPCGLNQMYSLRYGTIPVVRETGGLADTVKDIKRDPNGNGFVFTNADPTELYDACMRALELYQNQPAWNQLIRKAMSMDFSWHRAAENYKLLYEEILKH